MCRTVSLELVMLAVWMFSLFSMYISKTDSQFPFMTSLNTISFMDRGWLGLGSNASVRGEGRDAIRGVGKSLLLMGLKARLGDL